MIHFIAGQQESVWALYSRFHGLILIKDKWPVQGMESLSEMGYKTVAMALRNDSVEIRDPKLKAEEKLAIILGTEGEGLDAETMELCDYTVKIPMSHGVDSLNVAAASAVAFWELGQRS